MKTIAFFNNKGGVGKTTLVYHIASMFSELGLQVVAVDLDPQSNLTTAFLSEDRMVELWGDGAGARTILGSVQPLLDRLGDVQQAYVEDVGGVGLIPGDLGLNAFEDRLADAWSRCLDDNVANAADAFRVMTAFYRIMKSAAEARSADLVVIDVGPNLGALNRAALVAADHVVIPVAADLFSLRGLENLGPKLREWRGGWQNRRTNGNAPSNVPLPSGAMEPLGYVILQHAVRQDRPARAYQRWVDRIPATYHAAILGNKQGQNLPNPDPHMLATLKHYRSLMPLAQDARKPIFNLKPADGALGGHAHAVSDARLDFERLARTIASRCGIIVP